MITYEDFTKLDLRVGKIVAAEAIEKSEKLLKLQVNLGNENRTILAGIAKYYSLEDLLGQLVVIVANLEPREIMGMKSEGMLLCADSEEGPCLLVPLTQVSPGSKVK